MEARNYFDMIDDYLLDRLSQTDAESFGLELQRNKKLNTEVEQIKIANGYLAHLEDQKLRQVIKSAHSQFKKTSTPVKRLGIGKYLLLSLAAASVAILLISYFVLMSNSSPKQLYAQYHSSQVINFGIRSGKTAIDSRLIEAGQYYASKKYNQAAQLFEELKLESNDPKITFALANAYLEQQNFQKALIHFEALIDSDDILYAEHSLWSVSLIHLHENRKDLAIQSLQQLVRSQGQYQKKSKQLLSQLK